MPLQDHGVVRYPSTKRLLFRHHLPNCSFLSGAECADLSLEVASEVMPANALIIGVDLAPIKAIPRCITFQSDITTEKCRATIRGHLKT